MRREVSLAMKVSHQENEMTSEMAKTRQKNLGNWQKKLNV